MSLTTISYKYLIMMALVKVMIKKLLMKKERVWMTARRLANANFGETKAGRIPPKKYYQTEM